MSCGNTFPTILSAGNSSLAPTSAVAFKRPPGFKELREKVNKFAGDGKEDFAHWFCSTCRFFI